MVLLVISLRAGDCVVSFNGLLLVLLRGANPAPRFLALVGGVEMLPLLLSSSRDAHERLDRLGEVYQPFLLSPSIDDRPSCLSRNNGDRLVSTRWGERSYCARARSSLLGLPLVSRSAVLWKGICGLVDLVGVALLGLRGGLLDDGAPKNSVSADSFLTIGGGVAIEMKDLSGST